MIKTTYYQDLTKMNTFGMKVKTRCFMEYDSVADLVDIEFEELARPVLHIGGGSNLLFTDDFKGTVLHSKINFIEIIGEYQSASVAPSQLSPGPSPYPGVGKCHFRTNGTSPHNELPDSDSGPTVPCHSSASVSATPSITDRTSNCPPERSEGSLPKVLVSVGAGVVFDDFCDWAAREGLWGVENLSYIPGEVGASAVQNIGAYGVEVKDVIHRVYCYDTVEEEFVSFGVEECGYGYRDSVFKSPEIKGRYIVTHVVFALSRSPQPKLEYGHLREAVANVASLSSDPRLPVGRHPLAEGGMSLPSDTTFTPTPAQIRKAIIKIRKEKLPEPSVKGSAGSFFKNPVISAEHFAQIEATAKAEHGPDYKVPHYVVKTECHGDGVEKLNPSHDKSWAPPVHEATGGHGFSNHPHGTPGILRDVSSVSLIPSVISSEDEVRDEKSIPYQIKVPAAWLIEQCGWKGKRSGGAAVWDKQPLVIVNYTGEAYPEEIIGLEKRIIASVKAKFGIELHPEVEHV